MRKLLFEALVRRPLTDRAPAVDDTALAELAAALAQTTRRRLGRSLAVGEVWIFSEGEEEPVAHATGTYSIPKAS